MKPRVLPALTLLALLAPAAFAQAPATPAPAATAPAPPRTIASLRNKISAADLPSAESILEVHREKYGADGTWLMALGWLARGALLLGDTPRAGELNAELRRACDARLAAGATLAHDDSLENALGACVEVQAQLVEKAKGRAAAAAFVRGEQARFAGAPDGFRMRLQKRLNLLTLTGAPAPEIALEDWVGAKPKPLAERRGKAVVVFVWSKSCGDCRDQAATLARVASRHAADGLEIVPLTRFYTEGEAEHVREKAVIDSVWSATYAGVGPASIPLSTASMERYGGSSTPTFVFVDRRGVVRGYTPTRLTEPELERRVREILR